MDFLGLGLSNHDFDEKDKNIIIDYIKEIKSVINKKQYDNDTASIILPFENEFVTNSSKLVKKLKDANSFFLVGIGGSNLGTMAIHSALAKQFDNSNSKKNIYFADTLDPNKIAQINNIFINELKAGKKVVLNVISKSGSTTETIAIFSILEDSMKKYANYNYKDYVVITTDNDSKLEKFAKENEYSILNIPKKVGGRFSVFSNVSLFPLEFMGINTKKILEGAKDAVNDSLNKSMVKNDAFKSAMYHKYFYEKKKIEIVNMFLFYTAFEDIGKWFRQLLAESCAKEFNNNNKKVNTNITPMVSIGTTDLHSMAQLFLGGKNDKLHIFLNVLKNNDSLKTRNKGLNNVSDGIFPNSLNDIYLNIFDGVKSAFIKRKIGMYEIKLDCADEYSVGYLMQFFMVMTMFLGKIMNINTFDQPNVEEYKIETKKIMKND